LSPPAFRPATLTPLVTAQLFGGGLAEPVVGLGMSRDASGLWIAAGGAVGIPLAELLRASSRPIVFYF